MLELIQLRAQIAFGLLLQVLLVHIHTPDEFTLDIAY